MADFASIDSYEHPGCQGIKQSTEGPDTGTYKKFHPGRGIFINFAKRIRHKTGNDQAHPLFNPDTYKNYAAPDIKCYEIFSGLWQQ